MEAPFHPSTIARRPRHGSGSTGPSSDSSSVEGMAPCHTEVGSACAGYRFIAVATRLSLVLSPRRRSHGLRGPGPSARGLVGPSFLTGNHDLPRADAVRARGYVEPAQQDEARLYIRAVRWWRSSSSLVWPPEARTGLYFQASTSPSRSAGYLPARARPIPLPRNSRPHRFTGAGGEAPTGQVWPLLTAQTPPGRSIAPPGGSASGKSRPSPSSALGLLLAIEPTQRGFSSRLRHASLVVTRRIPIAGRHRGGGYPRHPSLVAPGSPAMTFY